MRQVGVFVEETLAQRFTNSLLARGIAAVYEHGNESWQVWVRDEDRVTESRAAYEHFLQNPNATEFHDVYSRAEQVQAAERENRKRTASHTIVVRQQLFRSSTARRAPFTMTLLILAILVGLTTSLGEDRQSAIYQHLSFMRTITTGSDLVIPVPIDPWRDIRSGEIWRIVTPIFLHFGIVHLAFNLIWLISLGSQIEARQGATWLALIVLISAITGNIAQCIVTGPFFGGLSGVVYGLFGYIWMRMKLAPRELLRVGNETVFIMVLWLVLGFAGALDGLTGGGIGNWAHLFGLIGGGMVGLLRPAVAR